MPACVHHIIIYSSIYQSGKVCWFECIIWILNLYIKKKTFVILIDQERRLNKAGATTPDWYNWSYNILM